MSDYDSISAQLLELNRGFLTLAREFSQFRGVVETGIEGMHKRQDLTNGRVTTLEAGHARVVVNQAAQDAFTPALFRAIEELKTTCSGRHEKLDAAILTIQKAESNEQVQQAHDDGERSTDAKYRAWLYALGCAIGAIILAAWQTWPPKWWPTK